MSTNRSTDKVLLDIKVGSWDMLGATETEGDRVGSGVMVGSPEGVEDGNEVVGLNVEGADEGSS